MQCQPLFAGFFLAHAQHVEHHRLQAEVGALQLELTSIDLGEIQHFIDDATQVLSGAQHVVQLFALRLRQLCLQQQLRQAQNGIQRCTNFMADGCLHGRALRRTLFGLALGLVQGLGLNHFFGDVQPDAVEHNAAVGFHMRIGSGLDPAVDAVEHLHGYLKIHGLQGLGAVQKVLLDTRHHLLVVVAKVVGCGFNAVICIGFQSHEVCPLRTDEAQLP